MSQQPNRKGSVIGAVEQGTQNLAGFIQHKVDEAKNEILLAVKDAMDKPDRLTDRCLLWVKEKRASWLIWPILALTHALVASIWKALG